MRQAAHRDFCYVPGLDNITPSNKTYLLCIVLHVNEALTKDDSLCVSLLRYLYCDKEGCSIYADAV